MVVTLDYIDKKPAKLEKLYSKKKEREITHIKQNKKIYLKKNFGPLGNDPILHLNFRIFFGVVCVGFFTVQQRDNHLVSMTDFPMKYQHTVDRA